MAHKIDIQAIENGTRYSCNGIYFDITNDRRYCTIYNEQDIPVGTITRPMVAGHFMHWSASNLDGEEVARTMFGARAVFVRFLLKQYNIRVTLANGKV